MGSFHLQSGGLGVVYTRSADYCSDLIAFSV